MGSDDIYLTRSGYDKIREELEYLKNVKRRKISQDIERARSHGDIGENAEYDAAKDEQALNEKRIAQLELNLSNVRILDDEDMPKDQVLIGATVVLLNMDTEKELQYMLVSELEADFSLGKISITSPVGSSLLGHKENEVLEIKVPAGILRYKILKITR